MDGTRKYAWFSGLPKGSPDFFCARNRKRKKGSPFSVYHIHKHTESSEAVAVEVEDEPRQGRNLDVIGLGGERLGLLEGAGTDHHILELRAKTRDQCVRQPAL